MAVAFVGFKIVCCEMSTFSVLTYLPVLSSVVCFVCPTEDSFGVLMGQVLTHQLTALSALSDLCVLCLWSTEEKLYTFSISK